MITEFLSTTKSDKNKNRCGSRILRLVSTLKYIPQNIDTFFAYEVIEMIEMNVMPPR